MPVICTVVGYVEVKGRLDEDHILHVVKNSNFAGAIPVYVSTYFHTETKGIDFNFDDDDDNETPAIKRKVHRYREINAVLYCENDDLQHVLGRFSLDAVKDCQAQLVWHTAELFTLPVSTFKTLRIETKVG